MKTLLTLTICCLGFFASAQHSNVSLLYHWEDTTLVGSSQYNNTYNECWGFVRNGHEFAVIGSTFGTHIFDITDISNVTEVASIPGGHQGGVIVHRDYHDYKDYLYAVCDEGSNSTLQIIDISNLPNSYTVPYDSPALIKRAHNIFIDTATAKMYANGIADGSNSYYGFRAYDISNPLSPTLISTYTAAGFTHDTYARNDTVFINAGNNGLHIVDYTNPSSVLPLGLITDYPYKGYNHSGWPSDDMKYYFLADENAGYKMKALDIADFSNINVISTFFSDVDTNYSMPHNQIWKDGFLYTAHYHDGLQIHDVRNPSNPMKVGYYSTYPLNNHNALYKGAWGVYPLLPSGKIIVSDMQHGLFILDATMAVGKAELLRQTFQMYPNPSNGAVNIMLPEEWTEAEMRVYSLDGRLIFSSFLNETISQKNLDLKQGIFLVELSNKGEKLVQKLVINN